MPEQAIDVFRIELRGLGVIFAGLLRIAVTRRGGDAPVALGRFFAPCDHGGFVVLRRLDLQPLRLVFLARADEFQDFGVARVARRTFLQRLQRLDALIERVQRPGGVGLVFRRIAPAGRRCVDEDRAALLRAIEEEGGAADENGDDSGDGVADAGLPFALALGAAENLVRGHADQRRGHLRQRQLAAVAFLAHVRRDGHGGGGVRDLPVRVQLEFQRGRKAFVALVVGLAGDDHRHDQPAGQRCL